MRKSLPLLLLLMLPFLALAQYVTVPKNVYVADVHVRISDRAQQEIQKKVDALHRNQNYFKYRVELADAYFPLIERVFKEEGVPDDLKYLAIQESGLIGDAVSTSNAVGYWQFKKEAASDFSLLMTSQVDERKHIIEASRGAAKYFKRSNLYYNNWFNTILSYNLGPTGAKPYTSPSDIGSRKMDVTENTHPYLLTYLAHKIAYESYVGKNTPPAITLNEVRATPGQSLLDIAMATQINAAELEKYNKWLVGGSIPSGKDYYVMVPVRSGSDVNLVLASKEPVTTTTRTTIKPTGSAITKRNGLTAIVAVAGDTKAKLASQAGISVRKFEHFNDMYNFDEVEPGWVYYLEPKRTSAEKEYHVIQPGESMLQISQHYGIKLSHLLFKNRMARYETPEPGRVLWMQQRRPARTPVEIRDVNNTQPVVAQTTAPAATTTAAPAPKRTPVKVIKQDKKDKEEKKGFFARLFDRIRGRKSSTPVEQVAVVEETPEVAEEPVQVIEPEVAEEKVEKPVPVAERKPVLYPGAKPGNTAPVAQPKKEAPVAVAPQPKPAPAPTSSSVPVAGATKHVVKQGETLFAISRMYSVSVNDLMSWNNLSDGAIKMDQELFVVKPQTAPTQASASATASTAADMIAPAVKPAPAASSASATHTVITGETLFQISRKYGVTIDDLRTWNNLQNTGLQVGQELRVKAPANQQPEARVIEEQPAAAASVLYHTVGTGESMFQISRKYGITIQELMEWNNKNDHKLAIGEKLLIKKSN